ncbi:TetR family transcriptional regulator [Ruminococcus sp.]|uniref:TetR family transcriptional regulator n=1 Tax=Ruminococcus sp. TaxID=41978 RepID=UPI0025EBC846|nr:TetR family transcriptional regulator [Ruminococcus sp.]MCR4639368.1 TetR/AcrR family transcriptional regulator [Ruminococcus sp.]
MPKGSAELTASRKEEIINACEKLYQTMSFKEITLKEISVETSFSRPSIYNYFQTKEEIFLALMQREYELWAAELNDLSEKNKTMTTEEFSSALAHSLEKHGQLLKLLSMNHYDMEENSRPQRLTEFKVAYGASLDAVRVCVRKFFPETDCESFIFVFFPFLFGVYPYSVATQKQLDAMRDAKMDFKMHSIYEIIYSCVMQLLGGTK